MWAGAGNANYQPSQNIPSGWLLCNGAAVSRTTYANLFAVIGTNFGTGNGSTTFNLPNYHDYWLVGAPSSLSTAPNPSGLPASWVVNPGVKFYDSFEHSTNGAHSSHATSMTPAGYHNHAASHTHVVTSGTSLSANHGGHTAAGAFNSAGSTHTHSVTSGSVSASGAARSGSSSASAGSHTHTVSFASGAGTSNHQISGVGFSASVSHAAHTHASGTGTSDDATSMGINADHGHTMSAIASAGGHAHENHAPLWTEFYYIIKT
jgi:microcystin-dependent protein